jgi:CHRD domain
MMRSYAFAAVLVLASLAAAPAYAETVNYKADLSTKSEVPPHDSLNGSGTLAATFDTATKKFAWKAEYSGLTGAATMAHFHGPAPVGKNAGVMVPLTGSLTSPVEGSATLTDAQVKALEAGDMYFNVHTAANKGGEIRGQVEKAN